MSVGYRLKVDQVNYSRNGRELISEIGFSIEPGTRLALVGLNGAGKSTLLQLLSGQLKPRTGQITYLSTHSSTDSVKPQDLIFKHQIGVQSSAMQPLPGLNVTEYLELCAAFKFGANHQLGSLVDQAITEWSMENIAGLYLHQLSQGNLQKVMLAQAFFGQPAVILLDEPSQALDPVEQQRLIERLRQLKNEQLCLFSSHHINEVVEAADQVLFLHQGQAIALLDLKSDQQCWMVSTSSIKSLVTDNTNFEQPICQFKGRKSNLYSVQCHSLNDIAAYQQKIEASANGRWLGTGQQAILPLFLALANQEF